MTINIYANWTYKPEGETSPVSTSGFCPIYTQRLANRTIGKIMYKLNTLNLDRSCKKGKYLVRLAGKDYTNELIGTQKECFDFIKICLSDLGILKEKLGRGRI